jgi:sulfur-oxidizing protein SoxA
VRKSYTRLIAALGIAAFFAGTAPVNAQDEATEKGLEQYRKMLKEDPWSNPGNLDVDRGETLWKTKAGPKNASLEQCDLGKGPGVVNGAFAELPRYFADADRVMDVEARIVWCIDKLQGIPPKESVKPFPGGGRPTTDIGAIATYIASKSAGMKFAPHVEHPKEKEMRAIGEEIFYRRQGPMDFSCATCHNDQGKRIRLQPLPYLANREEAKKVIGEWPAYRVSSAHVMTMQHRIYDCFWQMRLPRIDYGSDVTVALTMYLAGMARGGEISAPGLKR